MDEQPIAPTTGERITPADIQRQEFGVSRFGGYRMRDVDEFLDRLTESTEVLLAENERLRAGGSPIVGTSDLDEVNRQADEIVQRARDEAARIIGEASERVAPGGDAAGGVVAGAAHKASVDAFLGQERAFLQSLASLVQGHAESVKGMAREARRAAAPQSAEPAAQTREAEGTAGGSEDISTIPEASDEPDDVPTTESETQERDETVVLEVPQPTTTGSDRDHEGDPSLRRLFWGEER
jgi:DivIVA domain-containing protein